MEQKEPFKPGIRRLARYLYLVQSETDPTMGHKVDVLRLKCGCPAGKYERRCKHLVLALQFESWRKRQGLEP